MFIAIALRWSATLFKVQNYKHRAPPEHFTRQNHFSFGSFYSVGGARTMRFSVKLLF